jgi:predicted metalloprotease with PDZ domain
MLVVGRVVVLVAASVVGLGALGQVTWGAEPPRAVPAPLPPPLAAPVAKPYPGRIDVTVDATDLGHHVFSVTETVPVAGPGEMVLLYPKWIPCTHGPTGPLPALAGLVVTANGSEVAWQRDVVDPFAFHVVVPKGAAALNVALKYLSPPTTREGDVTVTESIAILEWYEDLLYPAGTDVRGIEVSPHVVLPDGWQYGTALTQTSRDGDTVNFAPVKLDVLIDSPVYAGKYFARFDLAPGAATPVHLDVVADGPEDLAMSDADLTKHRALVTQAARNFASQHYDHFDFLLSVSDEITYRGCEHHRSSDNGQASTYFSEPEKSLVWRDLLPHEYTHSWDGKFRRPADLYSPDYNAWPMRGSLLWVYEGQTEYWGQVLAARSGLTTAEQFRDFLALYTAGLQLSAGRDWRDLQDTTNDPVLNMRRPLAWHGYSRAEDYYMEGALIWLDADTLIREKTGNRKSLTSFAQAFFGVDDGNFAEATYTFDDVVAALNAVYPYDWREFLRARLDSHPNTALTDGITRAGWRLVYTDIESAMQKTAEGLMKGRDFSASLGLSLGADGTVTSVVWGGLAFKAGLSHGVKIAAVDGRALDDTGVLARAITRAKTLSGPIELLVLDGQYYHIVSVNYHDGLRYPHLERIAGVPDRLADILAPLGK